MDPKTVTLQQDAERLESNSVPVSPHYGSRYQMEHSDGQPLSKIVAIPLLPRPEIISDVLGNIAKLETVFTDYQSLCEDRCFNCDICLQRLSSVSAMLLRPDSMSWEVWNGELVGLIYMTRIVVGSDALAHFAFFDGKLSDKRELLDNMIEWVFEDHDGWIGLKRITVEIPDYAFALAHFAQRKLGFGGPIEHKIGKRQIMVEGVKRKAVTWQGDDRDILIMSRFKN